MKYFIVICLLLASFAVVAPAHAKNTTGTLAVGGPCAGCANTNTVKTPTNKILGGNSDRASFVSLSGIDKLNTAPDKGLPGYVNAAFMILITVSAMLAVIFISIAGVKYMTVDMISSKEDAKEDIRSALIGLLIILTSVIILETINPCIVEFNILSSGGNTCSVHK